MSKPNPQIKFDVPETVKLKLSELAAKRETRPASLARRVIRFYCLYPYELERLISSIEQKVEQKNETK